MPVGMLASWKAWRIVVASVAALATGCTVSYTMKPEVPGRACPAEGVASGGVSSRVSWYGPARSGDEEALGRWCAAVGPLVIDSVPAEEFGAVVWADSLAVVTWNIAVGGADLLGFIERELYLACGDGIPVPGERFAHFALLLQEANRRSDRIPRVPAQSSIPRRIVPDPHPGRQVDVVEAARECGLSIVYVPSMRNGYQETGSGREDRGNAILSTLPLSDFIAIELPFEAQRKVAVGATVHMPNADSLRVISVHLDVSATLYRTFVTGMNSPRVRQGFGLVEALWLVERSRSDIEADATPGCEQAAMCGPSASAGYSIASVAGGDFNTWSSTESMLLHLRDYFPQTPPWHGEPTRESFPTDFLFFRRSVEDRLSFIEGSYRRIEDSYYSDHHPVIGWLRVRR